MVYTPRDVKHDWKPYLTSEELDQVNSIEAELKALKDRISQLSHERWIIAARGRSRLRHDNPK